jgi:hypothetical protein
MARRDSGRRYLWRFGGAMLAYVVLLPIGTMLAQALGASPWRFVVVLLPLPAVAAVVWALWRYVVESDEMQARIQLEALAVGVAIAVLLGFGYGQLESVGAPHLPWIWVTPLLIAGYGIGGIVARMRRR